MKLKNILKSKGFLVYAMVIAILAVLAICWFAGRKPANSFQPEEPAVGNVTTNWQDTPSPTANPGNTGYHPETSGTPEAYPKVVAEDDAEIIIDFTPEAAELQPELPDPPISHDDATNPSEPPSYEPEDTAPAPSSPAPQTPEAGSSNGNGAVYDPVFGWVVPGDAQPSVGDSNGDINKMVGNMGD